MNAQQDSSFSINSFFNELPIRIIGSPDEPFFYASDIATVLGIKNVSMSILNFTPHDIVTPEIRERHNLVTYKQVKGKAVRNDKIILLTECGVYKLIMRSRADLAETFQYFICQKVKEIRLAETAKLKVMASQAALISEEQVSKLKLYESLAPIIHVFKIIVSDCLEKVIPDCDIDYYIYGPEDACEYKGTWYKYTTESSASDLSNHKKVCSFVVSIDGLFAELDELDGSFPISPSASRKRRYSLIKPTDLEIVKGTNVKFF